MKKTDWIFLISVLLYSLLFWKQMPGLNILIFSIVLLVGQVLLNTKILQIRQWQFAALGTVCSAICVFYYGSLLSIFATFFSLLISSYFAFNQKGSMLMGIVSSIVSITASIGFMIARIFERKKEKEETSPGGRAWKKFLIVIAALVVVLIFFFMYRDSSLLFYNLTQKINFDWISFGWICFTMLDALVVYGFYYHNTIPGLDEWDAKRQMKLDPEKKPGWLDGIMGMESERFSGIVLLVLLNVMILLVNVLDLSFVFTAGGKLPQGISCKEYVHQGVGTLITSIIFAMLIILYYFRGRMNFTANGKALRILALLWIFQNAIMLISTFWRNEVYELAFGLTYKRIGVTIYLLLTLIGLIVTAWKVQAKKTNAFLLRMNSWLFYGVWVLACFVNWDARIINNNTHSGIKPDLIYLNSLSDNIIPELVDYSVKHPLETENASLTMQLPIRTYLYMCRQKYLRENQKWPSYVMKSANNYDELLYRNQYGKGKRLNLWNSELKSIYYFQGFSEVIAIEAGHNDLDNIGEATLFPKLQILDLTNNPKIKSIEGLEKATSLEYIILSGTSVTDFTPLLKLKNLKSIGVDYMSPDWQDKILDVNPTVQITAQNISR